MDEEKQDEQSWCIRTLPFVYFSCFSEFWGLIGIFPNCCQRQFPFRQRGCAFQDKYISRFDKFCKHSLTFGYTSKQISFNNIIADRDRSLWNKLNNDPDHCLKDLLPERRRCRSLRNRRHNYILPQVRTERFKRCFVNRCLFKF